MSKRQWDFVGLIGLAILGVLLLLWINHGFYPFSDFTP
jgi:hypothetical protein